MSFALSRSVVDCCRRLEHLLGPGTVPIMCRLRTDFLLRKSCARCQLFKRFLHSFQYALHFRPPLALDAALAWYWSRQVLRRASPGCGEIAEGKTAALGVVDAALGGAGAVATGGAAVGTPGAAPTGAAGVSATGAPGVVTTGGAGVSPAGAAGAAATGAAGVSADSGGGVTATGAAGAGTGASAAGGFSQWAAAARPRLCSARCEDLVLA